MIFLYIFLGLVVISFYIVMRESGRQSHLEEEELRKKQHNG